MTLSDSKIFNDTGQGSKFSACLRSFVNLPDFLSVDHGFSGFTAG